MNIKKATPHFFIIKQELKKLETYGEVETKSGFKVYLDKSFEVTNNVKPYAEIIAVPPQFQDICEVGDFLIVHKNILLQELDSNVSLDYENEYFLYKEEDFAYFLGRIDQSYGVIKKDTKEIIMFDNFALVKGDDKNKDRETDYGLLLKATNKRKFNKLTAKVTHIKPSKSVNVGDEVILTDYANYEYEIEGEKYWLLTDVARQCLAKIE